MSGATCRYCIQILLNMYLSHMQIISSNHQSPTVDMGGNNPEKENEPVKIKWINQYTLILQCKSLVLCSHESEPLTWGVPKARTAPAESLWGRFLPLHSSLRPTSRSPGTPETGPGGDVEQMIRASPHLLITVNLGCPHLKTLWVD